MRKDNKENKIKKAKRMFMTIGFLITILSLIGLFAFALGFYVIHPAMCGIGVIIGSGWFITACVSK